MRNKTTTAPAKTTATVTGNPCGFNTVSPYISTTPSGKYRVKVDNNTITCPTLHKAYRTRKSLLKARNAS